MRVTARTWGEGREGNEGNEGRTVGERGERGGINKGAAQEKVSFHRRK